MNKSLVIPGAVIILILLAIAVGMMSMGTTTYTFNATSPVVTTVNGSTVTNSLITTCSDNQILKWDTGTSTWGCANDASGAAGPLDDLSDVTISGVVDNDILSYNSTSGDWENKSRASLGLVLTSRAFTAGTGLSGGGTLEADRSFSIATSYALPQSCSDGQIAEWDTSTSAWLCGNDDGGGASTLASLTDTDIFSPSSDHLLLWDGIDSWNNVAMSGDASISNLGVIEVTQADALESNPTDCSTGQYATAIDASGNLTCAQVNGSELSGVNAGTDLSVDLEEETHASEHASGGADALYQPHFIYWIYIGNVALDTHKASFDLPSNATYVNAHCYSRVAPTGSAVIVQFQEDGVDIFADADRVSIAASSNEDTSGSPTDTSGTAGQQITMIIEAVDSGDTAEDLTCRLTWKAADLEAS